MVSEQRDQLQEKCLPFDIGISPILEGVTSKNLPAIAVYSPICRLFTGFDSITREKMKDILIIYGIPTEVVNAIMILYRILALW